MNYDQIERAFGAFLYRKGEGNSDREAFFKALDITSGGEAADVDPKRWREHIGNIDGLIYTEVVPEAPKPAQPDLEVVGWMHPSAGWCDAERYRVEPHCFKDGSDGGPLPLVRLTDAQAHIAALTAEVLESEKLRGQCDAVMAKVEELTRERNSALEAESEAKDCFWAIYPDWCEIKGHGISAEAERTILTQRAETAEARISDLEKERDGLREALEFYGDPANWTDVTHWEGDPEQSTSNAVPMISQPDVSHYCDCGDTARAALHPTSSREGE